MQPSVVGGLGHVIAEEFVGRARHIAQVDVQVAVLVVVGPAGGGGVGARADAEAHLRGDIHEIPTAGAAQVFAVVAEEHVGHPVILGVGPVAGHVEIEVLVVVVVRPGAARTVAAVVQTVADQWGHILEEIAARDAVVQTVGTLVGQVQVEPAIAVVIAPGAAEAVVGVVHAHDGRHVGPQPLALVVGISAVVAEQGIGAAVVVGQVQILVAVVVEVAPGAAHGVAIVADTGAVLWRHVREQPGTRFPGIFTVVAIETVWSVAAEVEVEVAVVVEIDPGHRAGTAGIIGTGLRGDIGEGTAAVVTEKVVGRRRADGHAGFVEIQVAVAVEVAPGHTLAVVGVAHGAGGRVLEEPGVRVAQILAVVVVEVVGFVGPGEPHGAVGDE